MENVLYVGTVVPAKESPDGDSPAEVTLTEEVNAYIVWYSDYDTPYEAIKVFQRSTGLIRRLAYERQRSQAIDFAVAEKIRRIAKLRITAAAVRVSQNIQEHLNDSMERSEEEQSQ